MAKLPIGSIVIPAGAKGDKGDTGPAGPNTVPTDAAIAAALSTEGTAAKAVLDSRIASGGGGMIEDPEDAGTYIPTAGVTPDLTDEGFFLIGASA